MIRRYSISSAPESADYLEISVKRQGTVSGALHSTVGVGSRLSVEPPAGRFVYPPETLVTSSCSPEAWDGLR